MMTISILRYLYLACIMLSIISCDEPKSLKRVWAIDDSEKIRQDDLDNPLAFDQNNKVWNKNTVNVFGARNEIIAFQLIVQADNSGVDLVNVEISNLTNGTSAIQGSATGSKNPFDYRGRNVELFTEHYLNMIKRSPPEWFFSESAYPSDYYKGWVPDCLIPFSAPSGKGGTPFSIDGNKNQGVWVDILIPKNAVAGAYTGHAIITIEDKVFQKIPIFLNVYDFTLPDSTHIKNMFGFNPNHLSARHGVSKDSPEYYELEAKYHQLAHRHRMDLVRRVANLSDMNNFHKKYLTGELYTSVSGYAGPGEKVGNNTFSIGYGGDIPSEYGESVNEMTESSWRAGSDAWETWFIQNAPGVERHKYLFPDEPEWKGADGAKGTGSMDTIRKQADWTHNNPGVGKNIPSFVTNKIIPELKGHVDFWSVSGKQATMVTAPEDIASEKSKGHKFGIYNGYRPGMGAVVSDADGIEFRVMPWIVWKYNIDQYFYWSTTFWTDLNVFVNPLTYENRINGDGTFFYPGQDNLFPGESRNLSGPLSSIRAKNWRRGAQDYEYLWLAKKMHLEAELNTIVNNCVPTGLWEAKTQKDISWSSRGYKFEEYRKQLAELLSSYPVKNE